MSILIAMFSNNSNRMLGRSLLVIAMDRNEITIAGS